jgi:ribosome-binding protein aMBF1 (putative translation factor)
MKLDSLVASELGAESGLSGASLLIRHKSTIKWSEVVGRAQERPPDDPPAHRDPHHPRPQSDFGSAIRRFRLARHLTIEGLALDAGMHSSYLSGIERGVRNPTFSKLADLDEVLEVPVSTFSRP